MTQTIQSDKYRTDLVSMQQAPNQTDKATDIGQMTQTDRATNVTHFASIQRTQTEGNRYMTH